MKLDRSKLLILKDRIDAYVSKQDHEEQTVYKQLDTVLKNYKASIDQILNAVKDDRSIEKFTVVMRALKNELGQAINSSKVDLNPIASVIREAIVSVSKNNHDAEYIKILQQIDKSLSKPSIPIKDRTDEIVKAVKEIKIEEPNLNFPDSISVNNFPPQKVPQPVTNININPLRGYIKTTAATVTSTLTQLPTYGVLNNRRSVIIYNNSSNTVFIGGSDVTTVNGIPVVATSFSPVFDAGTRMILYGIAESGNNNVRVCEASNDAIGG